MNLPLLEMPDEPAALAGWLERQIVGLHLADLSADLAGVYPQSGAPAGLDQVLGAEKDNILRDGLSAASLDTLRRLLRHPEALLELQERVFVEGGPHWQSVGISDDHRTAVAQQATALELRLHPAAERKTIRPARWRSSSTWIALAAAACLLTAFIVWRQSQPSGPSWGWGKPGSVVAQAATKPMAAGPYLKQLAAEAGEWHNRRPATRADLEKRLREMRYGCDVILAASHPSLNATQRDWLKGKCKLWAAKFDGQLAELRQGADVETVRKQADDTVDRLIKAINTEAAKLG